MRQFLPVLYFSSLTLFLFSSCAFSLYDQANSFLRSEQYEQAVETLRDATLLDPPNHKIWRDLGIAYLKNGKQDSALVNLEKAFEINPTDGVTIFYLGLINENNKNFSQAISFYRLYPRVGRLSHMRARIERRLESLNRKMITKEVKQAIAGEPGNAQDSTIAVSYFEIRSANPELARLQKGLAEIISYDLKKIAALKVLERTRLEVLLAELARSGETTVNGPRLRQLLGAQTLVKGSLTVVDDSRHRIRIDASLVGTESMELQMSKKAEGRLYELFRVEKALVLNIIDELGIILTDDEIRDIQVVPTEDMLAFANFSAGLALADRGRISEARGLYQKALARDPNFNIAKEKLAVTSNLQNTEEITALEPEILGELIQREERTRLGTSGALVDAGVLPGQDERDAQLEAANSEGVIGVPFEVEIIIP